MQHLHRLRLSRFTFPYRHGSKVAFFHTLLGAKLIGGRDLAEVLNLIAEQVVISPNCHPIVPLLLEAGFLVPSDTDRDQQLLEAVCNKIATSSGPSQLWIFVTDLCNSSCLYCRQRVAGVSGVRSVSMASLSKAVDVFFRTRNKKAPIAIFYYGGEPLLAVATIRKSHDQILKRAVSEQVTRIEFNLFTNGYSVTADDVAWIKEQSIHLIISTDGPPRLSSTVRLPRASAIDPNISFHRTVEMLHNSGVPFGVSCVVGAHNVKLLPEIAEYFERTLRAQNVYFIPAHRPPAADPKLFAASELIAAKMLEAHALCSKRGFYIENIMRRLRVFVEGRLKYADCGACGERLVLFPDGCIGPCEASYHRPEMRIDANLDYLNEEPFESWRGRTPLRNDECLRCSALGICGGGCPLDALELVGSLEALDERNCCVTRTLWNEFVRQVLESIHPSESTFLLKPADLRFLYGTVSEDKSLPARAESFFGELPQTKIQEAFQEACHGR